MVRLFKFKHLVSWEYHICCVVLRQVLSFRKVDWRFKNDERSVLLFSHHCLQVRLIPPLLHCSQVLVVTLFLVIPWPTTSHITFSVIFVHLSFISLGMSILYHRVLSLPEAVGITGLHRFYLFIGVIRKLNFFETNVSFMARTCKTFDPVIYTFAGNCSLCSVKIISISFL
jgi:hypothetical protein